ncbi:MAG: hypothetical protein ACYSR1_04975 [Planctomycetota bacterium]
MPSKQPTPSKEFLTKAFNDLLDEYVKPLESPDEIQNGTPQDVEGNLREFDQEQEIRAVRNFVTSSCTCGKNCQTQFTQEELLEARRDLRRLAWSEKNCFMLAQLRSCQHVVPMAQSSRARKSRTRQRFAYRINANRPVCQHVFLFYHGETLWRLKFLQKHLVTVGVTPPMHGNAGRMPLHAVTDTARQAVESFILNYAAVHGLPDPGRDVRVGKGKLRILLPTVMTFRSVHRVYEHSMAFRSETAVGYHTFIRIWHESLPYIGFAKARSDLCVDCENFKKALHHVAADLSAKREDEKIQLHQQAIAHLEYAKKERDHYRESIKLAESHYARLSRRQRNVRGKANTRDICMHYSWDFAQQVHYPYEDQQVGPIYFKTPRRAQLFGVCSEDMPCQVNYLLDEADVLDKSANAVISLLDHYFAHHGLGEKYAVLTADNCVGQNKNNAVLHYLLFRTLMGLHEKIDLSFMVVGHTKFAPDGYFGLIKYRYRRSRVYTYEQLADVIERSTENGHNICQRSHNAQGEPLITYRDWSNWLLKYFRKLPNLTHYHHFSLSRTKPGVVTVKERIDTPEEEYVLLRRRFPYGPNKLPRLPKELNPTGLSLERAWYLYEQIRDYIPSELDRDQTCPKPPRPKPPTSKSRETSG